MKTAAGALPDQVAIINDDSSERDNWSMHIEEAGYLPLVIQRPTGRSFASVDELLAQVEGHAKWAVCDHRLAPRDMAQFDGAQAVAALNLRRQTPALLVTTWSKTDVDVSIRLYRSNIPIMLSSDEFQDPEIIRSQLDACFHEVMDRKIPAHRVPRKTLIHVENMATESGIEVVDAIIPGWNPNIGVRFPLNLIDKELQHLVRDGVYFSAYVNRGAEKAEDLFLERFEIAPEVNPNDGLA